MKNKYGFWKWIGTCIEDKAGFVSTKRVGFFICLWIDYTIAHDPTVPAYMVWAFISLTFGLIGLTMPEWFSQLAKSEKPPAP